VRYQEDGADFPVKFTYYVDGTRNTITYPSGVTVTEQRDTSGRLTGVSDANGNIIQATAWQGNNEPKTVQLGSDINLANVYDVRGRLVGSRATRTSDGAVLTHMRYQYDGANNLSTRQFLHRNGKADDFTYDSGERVSEAQIGTVPLSPSGSAVPLSDRQFTYHAGVWTIWFLRLQAIFHLTFRHSPRIGPIMTIFCNQRLWMIIREGRLISWAMCKTPSCSCGMRS